MIGERVRHARRYCQISQTKLARLAGVTQPAISKIEQGGNAGSETLELIAQATGFPVGYFLKGPLPSLPEGSLRFRKRASSTKADDDRVRAHVRHTVELMDFLEQVAELPPVRLRPVEPTWQSSADAIESAAMDTREVLGVGPDDPVPHIIRSVELAGVGVVGSVQEIEKHDGASYWPSFPHGRPLISVDLTLVGDRSRLTVAHEVGHLILHQMRLDIEPQAAEIEANRFAGALLVPGEAFLEDLPRPVTLSQLAYAKARWGVSIRALVARAFDLGAIDRHRRVSLEKQIGARGWTRREPVEVPQEQPAMLAHVASAAGLSATRIRFATKLPRSRLQP